MTTLAQDAARLREMADELAGMSKRVWPHIKVENEHDLAYNVYSVLGGTWGNLRRSAGWIIKLEGELDK